MKMKWKETVSVKPYNAGHYLCYTEGDEAPTVRWFDGGGRWYYSISATEAEAILAQAMDAAGKYDEEIERQICEHVDAVMVAENDCGWPQYWIELPDMMTLDENLCDIEVEQQCAAATAADLVADRVRSIVLHHATMKAPWSK